MPTSSKNLCYHGCQKTIIYYRARKILRSSQAIEDWLMTTQKEP